MLIDSFVGRRILIPLVSYRWCDDPIFLKATADKERRTQGSSLPAVPLVQGNGTET